jgi:UPF0042 nucleotide-binding protein
MSGAGRSTVSAQLEDLGWTVIDNMPLEFIPRVAELALNGAVDSQGLVFVVGRSGKFDGDHFVSTVSSLRQEQFDVKVIFLDAPDDVLIRRYEGTRRRHPLSGSVSNAIAGERLAFAGARDVADVIIDTGTLNTNQLRQRIVSTFEDRSAGGSMRTSIMSFGYSNGLPRDVDLVFDCRFIPNPFWDETLRPLSGLDDRVSSFILSQPDGQRFLADVSALLAWQIPAFAKEGKSYLSIAIGCTGGRHRSVAMAEAVARALEFPVNVFHRDIDR